MTIRPKSAFLPRYPITFAVLLPILICLLLFVLVRLYHLMAMPPFIDEALHVDWAADIYRGRFFSGVNDARLLPLWWIALFNMRADNALWASRVATILFCLPTVALLYSLGNVLVSRQAGLIAAALYVFLPFAVFYERIILTDSYIGLCGLFSVWFAVRYVRQQRLSDAIWAGLALSAAALVKAQGLILIPIAAVVFLFLIPISQWQRILRGLIATYVSFGLIFGGFYLFLRWRGYGYLSLLLRSAGAADNRAAPPTRGLIERLVSNVQEMWAIDAAYFSTPLLIVCVLLWIYVVARRWRVGLAMLLTFAVPLGAMLTTGFLLRPRYVEYHVPLLILVAALGAGLLILDLGKRFGQRRIEMSVWLLFIVWLILFALPFLSAIYRDPSLAAIPLADRQEYISADSSGYGLPELASTIRQKAVESKQPITVVGIISNCHGFDLLIPSQSNITVECPLINFNGKEQPKIAALVNEKTQHLDQFDLYVITENIPYASLEGITAPYITTQTVVRPDGNSRLTMVQIQRSQ
jgi:hypothetical protein